jgi:serine/threonine-protein kinase
MLEQLRDYKIIKKIGEGGMGTVYLANDVMLERKVAIKVLNPLLTKESHFTERFRHEAKVQASLIHSNIVTLYNYFYEGDNYCMVMEYIEGVTLKQLITNTGPVSEQKVIWVLNQILEAVGYAHKKGIIHRDIKPSNILLTDDNNVKILDFGIAKILQDKGLTKTGTKMGTIYYMSPEQIKAVKDIDHRTDIYSIGVTLYEMLSGKIPFNVDTDSDFEIMNEIVSGEIKDPREIYPHISGWLVDVLMASVEKDRNKRIQSTDEFRNKLLSREGKDAATGTTDKTVIEEPKDEIKQVPKTKIESLPPSPVQKESKPLKKDKVPKPRSSKKKIFLFGGIGLIAIIIIYFVAESNSDSDPFGPSDPFFIEDSVDVYDDPYYNYNYNTESIMEKGIAKTNTGKERRYGPGIPSQAQETYAAN